MTDSTNERHGWISTEVVQTRYGDFAFANGYPTREAATALNEQLVYNRAVEIYLTQIATVAMIEQADGLKRFGVDRANQIVIWESRMDAATLLLTANTETVYSLGYFYLDNEGPTVFEAPPKMLGLVMDAQQRFMVDIGPLGPDKGSGGKYLFLPPGYDGDIPDGYFVVQSPTNLITWGLRGFLVDGKTDQAVALMKQMKFYPLAQADNPPDMIFLNGSGQPIDTIHTDTVEFYDALARLVNSEPEGVFTPLELGQMRSIGIERGKPFEPDDARRALLAEAVRAAAAIARANTFASTDPRTYFYPDRAWQAVTDVPYTFMVDGALQLDLLAFVYYMALGNSPAMISKNVGVGSQYLWTYKDANGDFLDGATSYQLHVLPNVPINNFWSVVVYDSLSRSELQNDQPLPSVSQYGDPKMNDDGSVDIYFGPEMPPGQERNWVQTVPGHGWFPIFRFYGPLEAYYDRSWKLNDIEKLA